MTARTATTERQKRLGYELRRMRTAAGVSAEYAAGLLGVDRGAISAMESGARAISIERLRTLACNCEVTDELYISGLTEMAQPAGRRWWDRYRGQLPQSFLDIAELEDRSIRMRAAYSVHMPGLLQTSDHALAVFRMVIPALPEHEVALRLALRVERQQVLDGENAHEFVAIVHEAALRMQFGGRTVLRAQLDHLLNRSEQDNVTVLVIPFDAGGFPGAGQTVLYAEGPTAQLDTVQVDNSHGPDFIHAETQLAKYRAHFDLMEKLALPPAASRDFIRTIASQL
ncbi:MULTISPECIES: helix-turn-helix transcriptional regulator [unclassified Streptomyces]|uniref:helix-turn-helix domain-containing protein n=1 Tax=unclassified Streptomyces TaxID=2593676 RepID=UPI001BEBF685|nr:MULTISPECIES: helix-turn-helix transcriptional regulator [unclassified Streptomyces]MBT2407510.1 helix-turn-helix transcriptional regulator [Streptomyces sp. ISL-21]MBT2607022.1 helix-turn-helix transcriptional regulator [Streptomyces sp. ISL-87]